MSELDRTLAAGEQLFEALALVKGVAALECLPPADRMEVAFAGRSNVGKSSLINAVVRHGGSPARPTRRAARRSSTSFAPTR